MTREEVKAVFPEATDEQADRLADISGREAEKVRSKLEAAQEDVTALRSQLEETGRSLEELKRANAGTQELQTQLTELQEKYRADTEAFAAQLADRDYMDAVHAAIEGVQFSSKAARTAFVAGLKENRLAVKDGGLEGFDNYLQAQKEADPGAFQSGKPAPAFSRPAGPGGPPAHEGLGAKYAKQFNAMHASTEEKE